MIIAIDGQKNDDDTIIAIKNIDIVSIFTINCPSLMYSVLKLRFGYMQNVQGTGML